jgi:hypothetical protein
MLAFVAGLTSIYFSVLHQQIQDFAWLRWTRMGAEDCGRAANCSRHMDEVRT